jgi:hypothetical protein
MQVMVMQASKQCAASPVHDLSGVGTEPRTDLCDQAVAHQYVGRPRAAGDADAL